MAFFSGINNNYQNSQQYSGSRSADQAKLLAIKQNASKRPRSIFNVASNIFEYAELNYESTGEDVLALTEQYNYTSVNYPHNSENLICSLTNDITDSRNYVFRRAWIPVNLTKNLFYKEGDYFFPTEVSENFYQWVKTITINQQITSNVTEDGIINSDSITTNDLSSSITSSITFRGTKRDADLWGISEILQQSNAPLVYRGYQTNFLDNGGPKVYSKDDKRFEFVYGENALSSTIIEAKPPAYTENPLSQQIGTTMPTALCGSFLLSDTQKKLFIDQNNGANVHGLVYTSGIISQQGTEKQNLFNLQHNVKYRFVLEIADFNKPDINKYVSSLPFPQLSSAVFPGYVAKIIKPFVQQTPAKTISPKNSVLSLYGTSAEVSAIPIELRDFVWKDWPNRSSYSSVPNLDYQIQGLYSSQNIPLNTTLEYDQTSNEYRMLGQYIEWAFSVDSGKNTRNWPGYVVKKWDSVTSSYITKEVEVNLGNYPCYKPNYIYSLPFSYSYLSTNVVPNINAEGIRIYVSDPFSFNNNVDIEDLTDLALCLEETVGAETVRDSVIDGNDLLSEGIVYREYSNFKNSVRLLLVAD